MTDKELDDLETQLRERWSPEFPIPNSMLEDAADAIAELREKNAGLVGALQEASGIIGIDAAAPRVNHALSRYTAFMEAE